MSEIIHRAMMNRGDAPETPCGERMADVRTTKVNAEVSCGPCVDELLQHYYWRPGPNAYKATHVSKSDGSEAMVALRLTDPRFGVMRNENGDFWWDNLEDWQPVTTPRVEQTNQVATASAFPSVEESLAAIAESLVRIQRSLFEIEDKVTKS
jgi:hypothetical protein